MRWKRRLVTAPLPLLSGRLLVRNVGLNVVAAGLPLVAAVAAIPILVDGFGTERFGLLAIVWIGIGYFSIFDLGLGRALTKLVAERLGKGSAPDLTSLIGTGLRLMLLLGVLAALVVAGLSSWLVEVVFHVSEPLAGEGIWSLRILAGTLPFVVANAGLVGVLQAHQRFGVLAAVRIPLGLITFLGPLVALNFTVSLAATTLVLAAARVAAFVAHWRICRRYVGAGRRGFAFERSSVGELLSFGGWITVSNVVGPVMVYFDRFFIGALLTITAVTYYTTPYEVVTRLWVVPDALGGVLFPALATAFAADRIRAGKIFSTSAQAMFLIMFPLLAGVVLFAPEGLDLWLGAAFSELSTPVLRWLAIGVFVNSLARLPFLVLQGQGRPDLTAKVHMAELPLYLVALWAGIGAFGIVGAAAVWTLRVLIDTVLLFVLGARHQPHMRLVLMQTLGATVVGAAVLATLVLVDSWVMKAGIEGVILTIGGVQAFRSLAAARRVGREVVEDAV